MSLQLTFRAADRLVVEIDELVAAGRYRSRAHALRAGVEALVDTERRRAIGDAIVEGYRRTPQTDDELATAERIAVESIREEPW